MSLVAMGKCEQHPQCCSEGVCPICLKTKLTHVWHGERRHADTTVRADPTVGPVQVPRETLAIIGSIASIAKRTQSKPGADNFANGVNSICYSRVEYDAKPVRKPHPSFDMEITEGSAGHQDVEAVIKDWAAFHAGRRNSQGKTTTTKTKKRVTMILDESPMVECYSRAGLPLVDRIAKETAMRVIKEVGDDAISLEDYHEELLMSSANHQQTANVREDVTTKGGTHGDMVKTTVKSSPGTWHSKARAKWVKRLVTNSSKVFPSKSVENVQKGASPARSDAKMKTFKQSAEKRKALRFNVDPTVKTPPVKGVYESGFTSEPVIEGMPDEILKHEDMNQRLISSYNAVLAWLQDLPTPQAPLFLPFEDPEDPFLPEPRSNNSHGEDLAQVGYLHEIIEEHENNEEEPPANQLSSFGKFLNAAAERQPRDQRLSRVVAGAR